MSGQSLEILDLRKRSSVQKHCVGLKMLSTSSLWRTTTIVPLIRSIKLTSNLRRRRVREILSGIGQFQYSLVLKRRAILRSQFGCGRLLESLDAWRLYFGRLSKQSINRLRYA